MQHIFIICEVISNVTNAVAVKTTRSCSSGKTASTCAIMAPMSQLKAAQYCKGPYRQSSKLTSKSKGGLGIIVHFSRTSHPSDGPDIVQVCTRPCPPIVLRFRALLVSQFAAQNKSKILYCAPSLTRAPILLSIALSSRPGIELLASGSCRGFLFARPNVPSPAGCIALFLATTTQTHLKAPRPFPVRTRSVRTREAVC